jgi:hypothetical protein
VHAPEPAAKPLPVTVMIWPCRPAVGDRVIPGATVIVALADSKFELAVTVTV